MFLLTFYDSGTIRENDEGSCEGCKKEDQTGPVLNAGTGSSDSDKWG